MTGHVGKEGQDRPPRTEPARSAPAGQAQASRTQAGILRLQRTAGNRAVVRSLSRWAAHPDKDKKGQFMTDQMAADWDRFNPPLSK